MMARRSGDTWKSDSLPVPAGSDDSAESRQALAARALSGMFGIGDALRRGFRHCRQRLQILDLLGAKSPSTTGHPHPLHSLEGSLHTPLIMG